MAHRAITLSREEAVIVVRGEDERLPRPQPAAGPAAARGPVYRALLNRIGGAARGSQS